VLAFLLGLLPALAAPGEMTTLETIELRYRTAAEVFPVVEPVARGREAWGTAPGFSGGSSGSGDGTLLLRVEEVR